MSRNYNNKRRQTFQDNSFMNKNMRENPLNKMEFPELINQPKVNIKEENNFIYKEMVEKESVIIEEKRMDGYITIQQNRENPNTIDIFPKKIVEIDEEKDMIMNIIATQNMLDKQYEDYKNNYIKLYGIDEYNKRFVMTNSHLPLVDDEESNE
jgi:hypothetical protein